MIELAAVASSTSLRWQLQALPYARSTRIEIISHDFSLALEQDCAVTRSPS